MKDILKLLERSQVRSQPYTKTCNQSGMDRVEEAVFSGEELSTGHQNQMVNPEKLHTSNMFQNEQVVFRNMYIHSHTHMQITSVNEKFIIISNLNLKDSTERYVG